MAPSLRKPLLTVLVSLFSIAMLAPIVNSLFSTTGPYQQLRDIVEPTEMFVTPGGCEYSAGTSPVFTPDPNLVGVHRGVRLSAIPFGVVTRLPLGVAPNTLLFMPPLMSSTTNPIGVVFYVPDGGNNYIVWYAQVAHPNAWPNRVCDHLSQSFSFNNPSGPSYGGAEIIFDAPVSELDHTTNLQLRLHAYLADVHSVNPACAVRRHRLDVLAA